MSHNIALPTDNVHPITNLVIRDRFGSEVAVGFGPEQIGIRTPGAHDVVAVAGEDLYALRELLNELPEEAFVRPAEPVDPDLAALRQAPSDSKIIDKAGRVYVKLVSTYENLQTGAWLAESQMAARGVSVIVTPQMWKTQ